jgi:hypothetical protein
MTSATWYIGLAQSWYKKVKALGSTVAAERLKAMMRLDKATFTTDFGNDGRNAFFLRGTRPGILQGRRVRDENHARPAACPPPTKSPVSTR